MASPAGQQGLWIWLVVIGFKKGWEESPNTKGRDAA